VISSAIREFGFNMHVRQTGCYVTGIKVMRRSGLMLVAINRTALQR